jgi:hypothetical protein
VKVFVASARGPATDKYRQVAIRVISNIKDADGSRWTAIRMEDDAYTDHDLRLGETFPTAEWGPRKIVQCHAMVLIVTWTYGSIVPDEDISFTEKEFNTALDNNVPVFAWVMPSDPDPVTVDEYIGIEALNKELRRDSDRGKSAMAFIKRIRAVENVISNDLPLDTENDGGFRERLGEVLRAFGAERTASVTPPVRNDEPSRSDEIVSDGVRAMASSDGVTVTWESRLRKGREHIRSVSVSWPADRPAVLAVRRAGHDAAYVVVRSDAGVRIVRVRQDGTAPEATLAVPFPVRGARLGRGAELGTVTLQSATGQVSSFRTDSLHFGEAWRADVGPQ